MMQTMSTRLNRICRLAPMCACTHGCILVRLRVWASERCASFDRCLQRFSGHFAGGSLGFVGDSALYPYAIASMKIRPFFWGLPFLVLDLELVCCGEFRCGEASVHLSGLVKLLPDFLCMCHLMYGLWFRVGFFRNVIDSVMRPHGFVPSLIKKLSLLEEIPRDPLCIPKLDTPFWLPLLPTGENGNWLTEPRASLANDQLNCERLRGAPRQICMLCAGMAERSEILRGLREGEREHAA